MAFRAAIIDRVVCSLARQSAQDATCRSTNACSSAVTRLKGAFPPFLQAHYHASVISALDWLIEGMRHDPVMAGMGIKIHRLAPIAVNTPFHTGGPRPPKLLEVEDVVREVLAALASEETVDKEIA